MATIVQFQRMPHEVGSVREDTDTGESNWAPRAFTAPELAIVDVTIVDADEQVLECLHCGEQWQAETESKTYWHCPTGCNEKLT